MATLRVARLKTAIGPPLGRSHSGAELAQVMVRVLVGPPLPVGERHRTKKPMRRLESAGCGDGYALEPCDRPREVSSEHRRLGSVCLRIEHRIRRAPVRPPKWRPQGQQLEQRPSPGQRGRAAWAPPKNHVGRVAEVTEHLLRRQRAPPTGTLRPHGFQPGHQGTEHRWIGHCPHR